MEGNCKECNSCVRSYHPKCIPAVRAGHPDIKAEEWECPECAPFIYEPKLVFFAAKLLNFRFFNYFILDQGVKGARSSLMFYLNT